jgi:hypothetical protein
VTPYRTAPARPVALVSRPGVGVLLQLHNEWGDCASHVTSRCAKLQGNIRVPPLSWRILVLNELESAGLIAPDWMQEGYIRVGMVWSLTDRGFYLARDISERRVGVRPSRWSRAVSWWRSRTWT